MDDSRVLAFPGGMPMMGKKAISDQTPPLPGIRARLFAKGMPAGGQSWRAMSGQGQACVGRVGDWFEAWLPVNRNGATSCAGDEGDVTVLVDGYISVVNGRATSPQDCAKAVLERYRKTGLDFVKELRGSYTILICDDHKDTAWFITDRRRSRPMFSRQIEPGDICFSPEVRELLLVDDIPCPDLCAEAVVEFLIFGASCDDHTLFSGITSFPQAAVMACSRSGLDEQRYWRIAFHEGREAGDEKELIEECHVLIKQAARRTLSAVHRPFLFLSGGVDSRILLGTLLEQDEPLPVVIYGTEDGDDFSVASTLAQRCNLDATKFSIPLKGLQDHFEAATLDADCRAETIDSPMASKLHRILGGEFGAFLNGDECFGWHSRGIEAPAQLQPADAIHAIGLRSLHEVGRLSDWLRPAVRAHAGRFIDRTIADLVSRAGDVSPADLMDTLYYEQRMGNMLNAFTAQRLRYMDQARPFLDEDVVDFMGRIPARYRYDKRLLRKLLDVCYPDLMEVPLATKDSIPVAKTYRRLFSQDAAMRGYVWSCLVEGLDDRLCELIDPERFKPFVQALLDGDRLPGVRIPLWARIPGMHRFHKTTNEVSPVSLVLRIIQLNIYLASIRQVA